MKTEVTKRFPYGWTVKLMEGARPMWQRKVDTLEGLHESLETVARMRAGETKRRRKGRRR